MKFIQIAGAECTQHVKLEIYLELDWNIMYMNSSKHKTLKSCYVRKVDSKSTEIQIWVKLYISTTFKMWMKLNDFAQCLKR